MAKLPGTGTITITLDGKPLVTHGPNAKISWDNEIDDLFYGLNVEEKCECGAEKCGSNFHSDWCPKCS